METVHAIFEGGVFRPLDPVILPERCRVEFEPRVTGGQAREEDEDMDGIYEVLDRRYSSGHTDTAARHNEHQP